MRNLSLLVAAAALSIGSPALADIVVVTAVNATGTESVAFADQAASTTIYGSTLGRTDNFAVTGTTSGGGNQLVGVASGTGGTVQGSGSGLTSATLSQTDGSTFTNLVFNVDATLDGALRITVDQLLFPDFVDEFALSGVGQNFFTITAINGQAIQSVTLTGLNTTFALTQVRFGPVAAAAGVPEPATWALMLLGFGAIGMAMRRRGLAALA